MKKSMQWQGRTGIITLDVEYTETMKREHINWDGYEREGDMKPVAHGMMTITCNKKVVATCWDVNFWTCIEINDKAMNAQGITHMIWGPRVGVKADVAAQINALVAEVITGGKAEYAEAAAYHAEEAAKKSAEEKAEAESIFEAAKTPRKNADGSLMTEAQAAAWRKRYNNLHNEGGEGYIPNVVTREAVDEAKKVLGIA